MSQFYLGKLVELAGQAMLMSQQLQKGGKSKMYGSAQVAGNTSLHLEETITRSWKRPCCTFLSRDCTYQVK